MSVRRHANGAFYFHNEINTAAHILKDKELLQEFFEKYDDLFMRSSAGAAGDDSAVGKELTCLNWMASVVSTSHYTGVEKEIKLLFEKYQGDGLRLVISIFLSNPSISKNDKQINIEKVQHLFDTGVSQGIYSNTFNEALKEFDVLDSSAIKSISKPQKNRFWNRSKH